MKLDKEQVMRLLPHRDPFLFVDSVEEIILPAGAPAEGVESHRDVVGTKVKTLFHLKNDLTVIQGHFPGQPILPGVIQIEMMAQASAFTSLAIKSVRESMQASFDTLLLSVSNAKFRKPIVPEMTLEVVAEVIKNRGEFATYVGQIYSEGELLSEGEFFAKLSLK